MTFDLSPLGETCTGRRCDVSARGLCLRGCVHAVLLLLMTMMQNNSVEPYWRRSQVPAAHSWPGATSQDCEQQQQQPDLPNTLVASFHRSIHLHEQAKFRFSGLQLWAKLSVCSFLLHWEKQTKSKQKKGLFSYFLKLWVLSLKTKQSHSDVPPWLYGSNVTKKIIITIKFCQIIYFVNKILPVLLPNTTWACVPNMALCYQLPVIPLNQRLPAPPFFISLFFFWCHLFFTKNKSLFFLFLLVR